MALSDVLSQIPGYAGYQAARARNQQQEQGQLQQAVGLAGIVAQLQKAEQAKALMGANPAQLKDPDFWSRMAVAQNKPEYETHAERLRKEARDTATLKTMRGAGVAPDPQEIGQAADQGTPVPVPAGGIFDDLAQSENPQIAQQAKALKAAMDKSGNSIPPQYWQTQQSQLAARETALLNRPGKAEEPLHPIVGPDGKPMLAPRSEAKGKTPYIASIAGAGDFSPEALRMTAEQYLAGDRQAVQGYARNATARIALQNEITKLAKEKGFSGADIAAQMADFAGTLAGSRTVGTRAAGITLAATEAEKMIPVAEQASKAFERTSFPAANAALKAYQKNTGRPEERAFGAALNSLVNIYARAISPSGVPTVSDKDHAREMISTIDSPEQFAAVMGIIRQELKIAKGAPEEVRAATRERVSPTGATAAATPTTAPDPIKAAAESAWGKYEPEKYEYRMNNGKPQRKPK